MLAKLICCIHKPKKQTILSSSLIDELFKSTPIQNVRNLGGKLGAKVVELLNVKKMSELALVPMPVLKEHFSENTSTWLRNLSVGEDDEPVVPRQLPKSIGCSKNFPGKNSLKTKKDVKHWLRQLADELEERLKRDQVANHRVARTLIVGIRNEGDLESVNCSRQTTLPLYTSDCFVKEAMRLLQEFNTTSKDSVFWKPYISSLSLGVCKFEDSVDVESMQITEYFKLVTDKSSKDPTPKKLSIPETIVTTITAVQQSPSTASKDKLKETLIEKFNLMKRRQAMQDAEDKPGCSRDIETHETKDKDRDTPVSTCSASGSGDMFERSKREHDKKDPVAIVTEQKIPEIWLDLPKSRAQIDDQTWHELPPDIRFELNQEFRKHIVTKISPTKRSTNKKTTSKSPARKSKKTCNKNSLVNGGTTLLDYYNKL